MKISLKILFVNSFLFILLMSVFMINASAKAIVDIKENTEKEIYILYDNGDCAVITQKNNLSEIVYNDVKKILTFGEKILLLKNDNTLWEGGVYDFEDNWIEKNNPIKIADNVVDVFGDYSVTMYMTNSGELFSYTTMWDEYGRSGHGIVEASSKPKKILDNVKKVNLYNKNVVAITSNDELYVWGYFGYTLTYNMYGLIREPEKIADGVSDAIIAFSEETNKYTLAYITTDSRALKYSGSLAGSWFRYYDFTEEEALYANSDFLDYYDLEAVTLMSSDAKSIGNIDSEIYVISADNTMLTFTIPENEILTEKVTVNRIKHDVYRVYSENNDENFYIIGTDATLYSVSKSDFSKITEVMKDISVFYQLDSQYFVSNGNEVYSWGHGWLGYSTAYDEVSLIKIADNIKNLETTDNYTIAVNKNNDIYTWGKVDRIFDTDWIKYIPKYINNIGNVENIALNDTNAVIITDDNKMWVCGLNSEYQFCDESLNNDSDNINLFTTPADITRLYEFTQMDYNAKAVDSKNLYMAYIDEEDSLYLCGYNYAMNLNTAVNDSGYINSYSAHNPLKIDENVGCVSLEEKYYIYSDLSGNVYASGDLSDIGINLSEDKQIIFQGEGEIQEIKACKDSICIFLNNGFLYKLTGEGKEIIDTDVVSFSISGTRIGVVKKNNTAWIDATENIYNNISKVALGDDYTLLLDTDGTLIGYGSREYAQLGNGDYNYSESPQKVMLLYSIEDSVLNAQITNKTDGEYMLKIEFSQPIDEDTLCYIKYSDKIGNLKFVDIYSCNIKGNVLEAEYNIDSIKNSVNELMLWTKNMKPLFLKTQIYK